MASVITEHDISNLLFDTSTDRKHLQVGLENQRVLVPKSGELARKGNLKMLNRIVHNIHENPVTAKWQGYVYRQGERIHVEYDAVAPRGFWKPINLIDNEGRTNQSDNSNAKK